MCSIDKDHFIEFNISRNKSLKKKTLAIKWNSRKFFPNGWDRISLAC
jgi:hypothetical protein